MLPITNGGDFARRIGFAIKMTGLTATGIVRCDQPRVLDVVARHGRHIEDLPTATLDEVMARVVTIFE